MLESESSIINKKLLDAAEKDDLKNVKFYIEEKNASPTITNDEGQTLIHIAAKNGNVDMIKYIDEKAHLFIIKPGMNYVRTAAEVAVEHGALNVLKYLMDTFRRNLSKPEDNDLEYIIPLVIEYGRMDMLKYFVEEKKVNMNMPGKWQNQPPIFLAVDYQQKDILKYLVEETNVTVTARDWFGENILYVAVKRDDFALFKYLLDERKIPFDVNAGNERGETLVHKASLLNRMKILEYLVDEKHADVNVRDKWDNMTALHFAAIGNHYECCKYLIEHGVNTEVRDDTGQTAAEKTSDPRLRELLNEEESLNRRRRHINIPYSVFPAVPVSSSKVRRLGEDASTSSSDISTYLSQLHNFFILARTMTRDTTRFTYRQYRNFVSSPKEILQKRIDADAIDAANTLSNFRDF